MEQAYRPGQQPFSTSISWDRRFPSTALGASADGTLAPPGSYQVIVTALDAAGNESRRAASIFIYNPGEPTYTPVPTSTATPTNLPAGAAVSIVTATPRPTSTPGVTGFGSLPPILPAAPAAGPGEEGVLWGALAAAAVGAATAYALEQQRKRREEEARQAAEATASAAAKQAAYDAKVAEEQRKRALANQMMEEERRRQQALQAAAVSGSRKAQAKPGVDADPDDPAGDDPEQEEMSFLQKVYDRTLKMANIVLPNTKKIGTQTSSPAYQDYRAGERNAMPQQGSWLQQAGEWWQDNVATPFHKTFVEPIQQAKSRAAYEDYRAGERDGIKSVNTTIPGPTFGFTMLGLSAGTFLGGITTGGSIAGALVGGTVGMLIDQYGPNVFDALLGNGPNYRGLRMVEEHKAVIKAGETEDIPAILLAASLSIQGQWSGFPVDWVEQFVDRNPSLGPAQLTPKNLSDWGIEGDPLDMEIAVAGITERIEPVVAACRDCTPTDKAIVAFLAQNGGFTKKILIEDVFPFYRKKDGDTSVTSIDWDEYFADQPLLKDGWRAPLLNWRAGGQNYNTQYMLRLAVNDLQLLVDTGHWQLPEGVDLKELIRLSSDATP